MYRLAYFVSHPIQYQAPLLRQIASDPEIDLKVFFYSDFSLKKYQDREFGQAIEWDIPLTEGYAYEFLDCWGSKRKENIFRQPLAKNIVQKLKESNFDAVWVHGWGWLCSLQVILAAYKLNIPIFLRGDSNAIKKTKGVKALAKKKFLKWLFSKISAFLYIGNSNHQFYQSYGVGEKQLYFVPYAVDNDFFMSESQEAKKQRDKLKQNFNLKLNRPIILFAAKLIDKKRPQDLLEAYKILSSDGKQEPEPYLLFVGDGELRPYLEAEANATGWDSIRFLGFRNQSEMPAIYDLCDVFVLPSSFEPWGLSINEVMNAGKAIVVSDQVGCAHDLVLDAQNGQVFPVGDIDALAKAIHYGISNRISAGGFSFRHIQNWSFSQDISGIKLALNQLVKS